jgi:hypothetical protein
MKGIAEVYRAAGEIEAEIIKGKLESNGIPCFLKSVGAPFNLYGSGEVAVMVEEAMAEEAKRLIESTKENNEEDNV